MYKKVYNHTLSKERLATYKAVYSHLTLLKHPDSEPSESAGSHFSYKKTPHSIGLARSLTLPTTDQPITPDYSEQVDQFIDQCIHEYITWLAETELRTAKLRLSIIEPYRTTDYSPLHDKEATTD